jgi:hypothetical protein
MLVGPEVVAWVDWESPGRPVCLLVVVGMSTGVDLETTAVAL